MALNKGWTDYNNESEPKLPATLGVYELGDADGNIVYIGLAGAKSRFGLRGEIVTRVGQGDVLGIRPVKYRYEINMAYMTRFVELLEKHVDSFGVLPPGNDQPGEYVPSVVRRRAARRKVMR